ncbi:hypothetical protein PG993_005523 [Apiospora rasikravindrae]|uniref:Uncharacterized protein n=1 Tax=Apiospora rasikravindrae TaxID=990691 RepID=A0ABR1TIB3_9PEZI
MDDDNWKAGKVVCALIGHEHLLLLELVDPASETYKRVGIGNWQSWRRPKFDWMTQNGTRKEITIM